MQEGRIAIEAEDTVTSAWLVRGKATAKIEEHQRALKPENNHRTATDSEESVRMTKPIQ